uniref:Nonstructural protein n=1 Tax=Cygnus atratus Chaphamaparvovirus TaxID=2794485 RepID=A0A8A4XDA7_9VIRU|nr:MAG: nonstructural protein [Cygnus atratus Chaphamaparvovirus]WCR62131.1 MAG: nonstructural protein [Chaphamaparvovirus sp.]
MEANQHLTLSQIWNNLWERYGNENITLAGFWMKLFENEVEDQEVEAVRSRLITLIRYWNQKGSQVESFQALKEQLSNLFAGTLATLWSVTTQEKLITYLDELLATQEITPEICALYQPTTIMSTSSMTVRTQDPVVDVKSSKKRKSNLSVEERLENVKRSIQSNQISGMISSSISFPTADGCSSLKWEAPWSDFRLDIKIYKAETIKQVSPDRYWEHALFRAQVNYPMNSNIYKILQKLKEQITELAEQEDDVQITCAKKWKRS